MLHRGVLRRGLDEGQVLIVKPSGSHLQYDRTPPEKTEAEVEESWSRRERGDMSLELHLAHQQEGADEQEEEPRAGSCAPQEPHLDDDLGCKYLSVLLEQLESITFKALGFSGATSVMAG